TGPPQAHLGIAGRGEVPGVGDPSQVWRKALVAVDALDGVKELLDVSDATALGLEPAARLERRVKALEQAAVIEDPVKRRVGEDRVDGLVELDLQEVRDDQLNLVAKRLPRLLDHRWRTVDSDHPPPRELLEQKLGHTTAAATRVQHSLAPVQLEPVDDLTGPL